jgi:hypothetical protein
MNEESGSILDFICAVFEDEPKPKNSFNLTLDYSHLKTENEIDEYLFQQLINIFVAGCKLKYGEVIILENIVGEKKEKLNKYFNSFGYTIFIDIGSNFIPVTHQLKLKDYYLKINSNNINYYIYFDKLYI